MCIHIFAISSSVTVSFTELVAVHIRVNTGLTQYVDSYEYVGLTSTA